MPTSALKALQSTAEFICGVWGCEGDPEGTIVITDDAEISELNKTYRGIDGATDVLSFAYQEAEDAHLSPDLLGDIIISAAYARRTLQMGEHRARVEAQLGPVARWGIDEELVFLAIHGFLHLLGYDHAEEEDEAEMRAEESRVFAELRGRVFV